VWVASFDTRVHGSRHLAFGNFALRKDGRGVIAVDPGTTAACQLCCAKRGNRHELERSHQVRRADQSAPAVRPKKAATRRPRIAAASNAKRSLRFTARSC
jgi:hypothetical protein